MNALVSRNKPLGFRRYPASNNSALLSIPRGGFNLATTTAAATSAVVGLHGGLLLVNPNGVLRKIYQLQPSPKPEDDELSKILMRSIGCVSIGFAISLFLSVVLEKSKQVAVAFGLVPRLLCFMWILARHRRTPFLVINTIMGWWCTFALLKGLSVARRTWRIFSTISMIMGLSLVVAQRAGASRFLGFNNIGDKPQALSKAFGSEVATCSLFMGSMALGVSPVRAAAYSYMLWIGFLADMAWRDKTWKLMDDGIRTQYIQMVISALFATGFFLSY